MKKKIMAASFMLVAIVATNLCAESQIPKATFNHFDVKSNSRADVSVSPGNFYTVEILDTCPKLFKPVVTSLTVQSEQQPPISYRPAIADDSYDPPQKLEDYVNYQPNGVDCYIDPKTHNKISMNFNHTVDDGGAVIRLEYATSKSDGVTALRIKNGKSVDALNEKLASAATEYKNTIDPTALDKAAKAKCESDTACKTAGSPANQPMIDQYKKDLADEAIKKSKKAVADSIAEYTEKSTLDQRIMTVVANHKSDWRVELAGAFTTSMLTDKKYGSEKNDNDENIVVRQKSKEDNAALGLAAFIHIANPDLLPYWAPLSFGLGINKESTVSYFLGTSLRLSGLSDKAYLTLGYNWGPTITLPAGVREGSVISDPNTLSNDGTRTGGGVFLAVSFSFLGTDTANTIAKPFLDAKK